MNSDSSVYYVCLLVVSFLALTSLVPCAAINKGEARMRDITYSIDNVLVLRVEIEYWFDQQTVLSVEVAEAYSPEALATKTVELDAASGTQTIVFQLKPRVGQETWPIEVSLHLSNSRGEKVELLHSKIIDVDLRPRSYVWEMAAFLFFAALTLGLLMWHRKVKREKREYRLRRKTKRKR
jgi:hypothetical protein